MHVRSVSQLAVYTAQLYIKVEGTGVWKKISSILNCIYVLVRMKTSFLLLLGYSHLKFIQTFVNEQ